MDAVTYRRYRGLLIAWSERPDWLREPPTVTTVEWVKVTPTLFEDFENRKVISRRVSNNYHRQMFPTVDGARGSLYPYKPRYCRWCRLLVDEKRRLTWHQDCLPGYYAATVNQGALAAYLRQRQRRESGPVACDECGAQGRFELDHRDALSVAWASGSERRLIRALTLGNLRWLCHHCHKSKSGRDRQLFNQLLSSAVTIYREIIVQ